MRHTAMNRMGAVIALVALMHAPAFAGSVYKWVDKDGKVHYTSTPPPEQEVKKLDIPNESTSERSGNTDTDRRANTREDSSAAGEAQTNPAQMCNDARRNINRGVDEWLESAEEGRRRGNTQERYQKAVDGFKQFRAGINRQLSGCPSRYPRDADYRKMVDCLANLVHPSNFMSCEPEKK